MFTSSSCQQCDWMRIKMLGGFQRFFLFVLLHSWSQFTMPVFTTLYHKPSCEVPVLPLTVSQAVFTITLPSGLLKDQRSATPRLTNSRTLGLSETSGSGWLQLLVHVHTPKNNQDSGQMWRSSHVRYRCFCSLQPHTTRRSPMPSEALLNSACLCYTHFGVSVLEHGTSLWVVTIQKTNRKLCCWGTALSLLMKLKLNEINDIICSHQFSWLVSQLHIKRWLKGAPTWLNWLKLAKLRHIDCMFHITGS